MDAAHIVKLLITVSLLLMVFGLGLRASFAEAASLITGLFRRPHRLLRATLAMHVIVPTIAVAVALSFDLPQPARIALLAMAVSPVPPVLPGKQLKFGGSESFVYGLLVAISLTAVVVVPITVEVLGVVFHHEVHIGADVIAKAILATILLPLLAGLIVRHFAAGFATRIAPWASRVGTLLLLAGIVPVLFRTWPAAWSLVGSGAVLVFAFVAVAAIAVGHLLGGPDPHDRPVLAIASAMRHPGVALGIAHANFPEAQGIPAAILLFLLVGVIATTVYGKLALHRLAKTDAGWIQ